jgi:hypothetical protein
MLGEGVDKGGAEFFFRERNFDLLFVGEIYGFLPEMKINKFVFTVFKITSFYKQ